jgi:hypothetical protein
VVVRASLTSIFDELMRRFVSTTIVAFIGRLECSGQGVDPVC